MLHISTAALQDPLVTNGYGMTSIRLPGTTVVIGPHDPVNGLTAGVINYRFGAPDLLLDLDLKGVTTGDFDDIGPAALVQGH